MDKTKTTKSKSKRKRLWMYASPAEHARIKARAALQGIYLEEFIRRAVLEALNKREGKAE